MLGWFLRLLRVSRGNRRRRSSSRYPLLFGAALCLVLGGLLLYRYAALPQDDSAADVPAHPEQQSRSYRFYTMLPRAEVDVPSTPQPLRSRKIDTPRWLQAGFFCHVAQAEHRLQEIAALGFAAEIAVSAEEDPSGYNSCSPAATGEEAVLEGRPSRHYRVYIGPFADRLNLANARRKIRRAGIDTLERSASPQ